MQPLCVAPRPAAISAAMNNPVVVAIEKKLEAVRAELLVATSTLLDDLRREQQQLQREADSSGTSRVASAKS